MASIAARLSLPNSSRVMHSHSRTNLFPKKHAIEFAGDGFGHGRQCAHGMAVDDGFGGGFQNFQTVESLQDVAAGDQHAVVFEQRGGTARRHGGGQRLGVTELQAVREAADLADHDVALRDGAAVQRHAGDAECRGVHRVGVDDSGNGGMLPVDLLVEARGAAGNAAGFTIAAAHQHQLVNIHGAAVLAVGGDEETLAVHARRETALRADEEALAVGAAHELGQARAQFLFVGGGFVVWEGGPFGGGIARQRNLLVGQVTNLAQHARFDDGLGGEFQRLEAAEGLLQIGAAGDRAVVFQQDAIESLSEDPSDVAPQGERARQFVGRKTDLVADQARLVEEVGIGNLVHQAERHQRYRMGVHNAADIVAFPVNLLVEGQFGGRAMRSFDRAIGAHADDVLAAQAAFVEARGGDPDIASVFADGEVAARRGSHAVAVDALNGLKNFVARMDAGDGGSHTPIFAQKVFGYAERV